MSAWIGVKLGIGETVLIVRLGDGVDLRLVKMRESAVMLPKRNLCFGNTTFPDSNR
jgi:hypothetical protein